MGYISWTCAKSGKSIASIYSKLPNEYSACYLVTPKKLYYEPSYIGDGIFGGAEIYTLLGEGDSRLGVKRSAKEPENLPFEVKIVLAMHYNGESYHELPASKNCRYQGFFYSDDYLISLGLEHLVKDDDYDPFDLHF